MNTHQPTEHTAAPPPSITERISSSHLQHAAAFVSVAVAIIGILFDAWWLPLGVGVAGGAWLLYSRLVRSPWQPGRRIGPYRLIDLLATGGMGEVWEAHDELLDRTVVLKRAHPFRPDSDEPTDPATRARVLYEAQLACAMGGPSTPAVYGAARDQRGQPYFAMERLYGRELGQLLRAAGPLTIERAAHLIRSASAALAGLHEQNWVHCDIKPANLFVSMSEGEETVKLIDFGVARRNGTPSGKRIEGTPAFLAPERVSGAPAAPGTDIYALGCVAYTLLTGAPPFPGDDIRALAIAHTTRPAPAASEQRADLPAWLDDLILDCLAKEPSARPTCREICERIDRELAVAEPTVEPLANRTTKQHAVALVDAARTAPRARFTRRLRPAASHSGWPVELAAGG